MPHLHIFNRYWRVGSDDLVIPSIFSICFRVIMFVLILLCSIGMMSRLASCKIGWFVIVFLAASLIFFLVGILVDVMFIYNGLQGTIVETEKRQYINLIIIYRIILFITQFCLLIYGVLVLVIGFNISCINDGHETLFSGYERNITIVVIIQYIDSMFFGSCALIFYNRYKFHIFERNRLIHN